MSVALDQGDDFAGRFGVTYLTGLRDGEGVTGRVRRIARRLGQGRVREDEELYRAHGGHAAVAERLRQRMRDPGRSLLELPAAEERLFLTECLATPMPIPITIDWISAGVGYGVFAASLIRPGAFVGEYAGVLRAPRADDHLNHYLAQTPAYGRVSSLIIDGRDEGNHTRFINHSFTAPNISNGFVFFANRWRRVLRADRVIRPGEQLLWNYGEEYWRHRAPPAPL